MPCRAAKEAGGAKEVYDIEFKQDGRKLEADILADERIDNWQREFAAKDLPKAVTDAVDKKYPHSAIREVMEITEIKDKKLVELSVAKDCKILADSGEKK